MNPYELNSMRSLPINGFASAAARIGFCAREAKIMDSSDTRLTSANPPTEWARSDVSVQPPTFLLGTRPSWPHFQRAGRPRPQGTERLPFGLASHDSGFAV